MDWKKLLIISTMLVSASVHADIWDGMDIPSQGLGHNSIKSQIDENTLAIMREANIPGLTLAISKNGRLIYSSGHGYSNWDTQEEMQPYTRAAIGSTSKVLVTLGMLHLLNENPFYNIESKVYGNQGILNEQTYETAYTNGIKRHNPIIGMAVTDNNRVVTWYSDGKYTVGKSDELSAYRGPRTFSFPPGKKAEDVLDMAFGGTSGLFITYFKDNTYAVGKAFDLDYFFYSTNKFEAAQNTQHILGIAADTTRNRFYAYYDDGTVSSGNTISHLSNRWTKSFQTAGLQKKRYRITAMARTHNGNMLAWFRNGKYSKGSVLNIGSITSNATFESRTVPNAIHQWKNAYRNISIKHLLSHTSGLVHSGNRAKTRLKYPSQLSQYNDDYLIPYEYSNRYILSTNSLLFKPGHDSAYSNHGLGLTGHLINTISGLDWYTYLRENILAPVGLASIVPVGQYHNSNIDSRHHKVDHENDTVSLRASPNWPNSGSAAGSLRSSAQDLAALLVRTDQLSNYPDVLPSETLQMMETRPFPATAPTRALGWQISCQVSNSNPCNGIKLHHNGKIGYGTSYMAKYKNYSVSKRKVNVHVNNINVVVIANSGDVSTDKLKQIMDLAAWAAGQETQPVSYDLFQVNPT